MRLAAQRIESPVRQARSSIVAEGTGAPPVVRDLLRRSAPGAQPCLRFRASRAIEQTQVACHAFRDTHGDALSISEGQRQVGLPRVGCLGDLDFTPWNAQRRMSGAEEPKDGKIERVVGCCRCGLLPCTGTRSACRRDRRTVPRYAFAPKDRSAKGSSPRGFSSRSGRR